MARLFSIFGDKKAPEVVVEPEAAMPTTNAGQESGIQFDPTLIAKLTGDHVSLVNQFTSLLPLLRNGDVKGFKTRLQAFKTEFQGHIIKENVKFYVYLEQALSADETNLELMRDFRREMNSISRAVVNFCNRYLEDPSVDSNFNRFAQESKDIAEALLRRIAREERDLYPLYSHR